MSVQFRAVVDTRVSWLQSGGSGKCRYGKSPRANPACPIFGLGPILGQQILFQPMSWYKSLLVGVIHHLIKKRTAPVFDLILSIA